MGALGVTHKNCRVSVTQKFIKLSSVPRGGFISLLEPLAIRSYQLGLAMYRKLVSLKRFSAEKTMHLLKDDEASPSVAISGGAPTPPPPPPADPLGHGGSDPGCRRGDRCAACPPCCSATWSCCSAEPRTPGTTTSCSLCSAAQLSFVLPSCVAAIRTLQRLHSRPAASCGSHCLRGHRPVVASSQGHCCPSC